jgi:hypothetical protein
MTRMSPPLRASNEHIPIVRVPRAQGTHRAIPRCWRTFSASCQETTSSRRDFFRLSNIEQLVSSQPANFLADRHDRQRGGRLQCRKVWFMNT